MTDTTDNPLILKEESQIRKSPGKKFKISEVKDMALKTL
jgi:hypothetical protein